MRRYQHIYRQRNVALKAVIYSTSILLGSIVVGQAILAAMDIQLISLQVAGGVILLLFALQMVFGLAVELIMQAIGVQRWLN
ncbi:hypothetical protein NC981_14760 [Leptolyngbya sp. DQ-M1]